MSASKWPSVYLSGNTPEMPRVCPNCLAVAEVSLTYLYPVFLNFLQPGNGTSQTFWYCQNCATTTRAFLWYRRFRWPLMWPLTWIFSFLGVAFGLILLLGVEPPPQNAPSPEYRGVPKGGRWEDIPAQELESPKRPFRYDLLILTSLLTAALLWGSVYGLKRWFLKRYPQRPGQAVWGAAAFCTHVSGAGTTHCAARPEWLKALVEANPLLADDATYERAVGVPKPEKYKRFD